jgi:hypothetical protein
MKLGETNCRYDQMEATAAAVSSNPHPPTTQPPPLPFPIGLAHVQGQVNMMFTCSNTSQYILPIAQKTTTPPHAPFNYIQMSNLTSGKETTIKTFTNNDDDDINKEKTMRGESECEEQSVYNLPWENLKLIKTLQQQQQTPPPPLPTTSQQIKPNDDSSSKINVSIASQRSNKDESNYDNHSQVSKSVANGADDVKNENGDDGDQYCAPWDLKMQQGKHKT